MQKKKILLVDKSFAIGGIQTALINMIENIKDEYYIDLLLYYPYGPLKERLPSGVNLLTPSWRLEALGMSFQNCIKNGTVKQKLFRIISTAWAKIVDNKLPISIAVKHQAFLGEYDVAIAFHHEVSRHDLTAGFIRVVDHCCSARKKISWIHNDCDSNPLDETFNDQYYKKADKIIAVSEAVKKGFIKRHPLLGEKVEYCYNFLDYRNIDNKCKIPCEINYPKNKFICFSACRLEAIKGLPRAIRSIAPILRENKEILWYIAGDGLDREKIENTIAEENLRDSVILMGNQINPYNYMSKSDLVMLLSYHEAAPMLYLEASYLGIPVFTTNLASSYEMLDPQHSIICDNSGEGIYSSFLEISKNIEQIKKMKNVTEQQSVVQQLKMRYEQIVFDGNTIPPQQFF